MKISTKGRYAVRVMLDLALNNNGECIKVKEIAGRQGISEKYLEQIIAVLNRAGYVKSVRGAQEATAWPESRKLTRWVWCCGSRKGRWRRWPAWRRTTAPASAVIPARHCRCGKMCTRRSTTWWTMLPSGIWPQGTDSGWRPWTTRSETNIVFFRHVRTAIAAGKRHIHF